MKRKGENIYLRILSSEKGADGTPRSRGSPWEKEQVLAGTRAVYGRQLLAALAIQEQESKGELRGRWEGLGWRTDQWEEGSHCRHLSSLLMAPPGEADREEWGLTEPLSRPHRDKTYFQLLRGAESRHQSSPLADIWGSSQNGEFLISNEELKHIVPIRKEMQIIKSGICVHDNRGNVFWHIWVHLYSNKYFSLWLWHFFA